MKTFDELIIEFKKFDEYKAQRKFSRVVKDVETYYPGVNQFFYAASQWGHEVSHKSNSSLYRLLDSLKHRSNIEELTQEELRRVYKFIKKNRLRDYEDMEDFFIGGTEDE